MGDDLGDEDDVDVEYELGGPAGFDLDLMMAV